MEQIRHALASISPIHLNVLLLLGIVLFGGSFGGRIFQRLRIPQVVGYIAIGVALGQSGAGLLGTDIVTGMGPISTFALGIIGFMIGGELKLDVLRRYGRQFTVILLFEALAAFVVVAAAAFGVGLLLLHDARLALSLGLLLGSIASATAPAATTDVLWEAKTRGPLTTMVLGIVAMDDGVALLLFAVAASIAGSLTGAVTGSLGLGVPMLFYEIGVAVALGVLMGFVLHFIVRGFEDESRTLAFSLGAILLLIGITETLGVDTILAAMSLGFTIANYSPRKSEETFRLVGGFAPPIYVLFFVLVGAKLNIWNISLVVGIFAAAYLAARTAGKFLGSYLGSRLSAAAASVQRYLPFCLFSQAGVAIGLSIVAGQTFPGTIGDMVIMIVTATTFVVQIIGPPFVKYAATKAGEVGLNVTEEDLIRSSKAREIADVNVPVIQEGAALQSVLAAVSEADALAYPVVDRGRKLVGVITVEHLKSSFMAAELLVAHDPMEAVVATCAPEDGATEVERRMKQSGVDALPLVGPDGVVQGMLELRHIRRHISRRMIEIQRKADGLG